MSSGPRFGIWILFCVSKAQNVKGQRNVNFQLLQITIISICYWKMPRYCSLYFFSQSFAKMNSCDTLEAVQFVHNICIVHVILYLSMLFCICMYCTLTNICGSTQGVTCLSPWRVSGRFLRNHLKQDLGQSSKFFLFDTSYHRIGRMVDFWFDPNLPVFCFVVEAANISSMRLLFSCRDFHDFCSVAQQLS